MELPREEVYAPIIQFSSFFLKKRRQLKIISKQEYFCQRVQREGGRLRVGLT